MQLSICLKHNDDDTFTLMAAIGEPGIKHARDVNASAVTIEPGSVASLTATVAAVLDHTAGHQTPMHDQLRDFIEPPTPTPADGQANG